MAVSTISRRTLRGLLATVAAVLLWAAGAGAAPGDALISENRSFVGGQSTVIRVTPGGTQSVLASGGNLSNPLGIAVAADGTAYVVEPGTQPPPGPPDPAPDPADGAIVRIDPVTAAQTVVASGGNLVDPKGITAGIDGALYVTDNGGDGQQDGKLIRVRPADGAQRVIATGLDFPNRVVQAAGGDFFVIDLGTIIRIESGGSKSVIVDQLAARQPTDLALGDPGQLYVTLYANDGSLARVNVGDGAVTDFAGGQHIAGPRGVALDSSRNPLVIDDNLTFSPEPDGRLVRVNRQTAGQTLVTDGGNLVQPTGIAIVPQPPTQNTPPGDTSPPELIDTSVSPRRVFPVGARVAVKRGVTFRYTISERAAVTITIQRRTFGRKVGGKCVKKTKQNASKKRCKRWGSLVSLLRQDAAGRKKRGWSARLRGKPVSRGRYRGVVAAVDAAMNVSKKKRLYFRVARP